MAKVTFRNIGETESKFQSIENPVLYDCVLKYAVKQEDDIKSFILKERISITVNNLVVAPGDWAFFIVEEKDEIVISPVLKGGKVGGLLQVVAAVTLFVVAPYLPQAYIPLAKAAAISLALGGVSSLLFQPKLPTFNYSGGFEDSPTYNWSGLKTSANEDSPIPILYGTHPVGGNIISMFTESEGKDSYLNMLIALSEGEIDGICTKASVKDICLTSDYDSDLYKDPYILLDDQFLSNYNEVQWWYRTGANKAIATESWITDTFYRKGDTVNQVEVSYFCIEDHQSTGDTLPGTGVDWTDYWEEIDTTFCPFVQNQIFGFSNARHQTMLDTKITANPTYITTTREVDRVTLIFKCPALYQTDKSTGEVNSAKIRFHVDEKKSLDVDYTTAEVTEGSKSYTPISTGLGDQSDYTKSIKFIEESYAKGKTPVKTYVIYVDKVERKNTSEKGQAPTYETYIDMTITDEDGNEEVRENVLIHKNGPQRFMDYNVEIGMYSIQFERYITEGSTITLSATSSTTEGYLEFKGRSKTTLWKTVVIEFDEKAVYDLKIYRESEESTSFYREDALILSSITEETYGDFTYPNTALLALRIKATDQLSGSPPNVKTLARGIKTKVPNVELSGDGIRFEDTIWDIVDEEWQTRTREDTATWSNETDFRDNEYTENAILCVNDLMTNTRYGLGEYITSSDISSERLVETIKDCHTKYLPFCEDSIEMDLGNPNDNWEIHNPNSATVSIDSSNYGISIESTEADSDTRIALHLPLNPGIVEEYSYSFSFDLTDNGSSDIEYIKFRLESPENDKVTNLKTWDSPTAGSFSHNFVPDFETSKAILYIRGENLDCTIDSIELKGSYSEFSKYHTWNGVLDSSQSAVTALLEMCSVFRCYPIWYQGQFNFVIDKDDTPVHTLSKGNTISFEQAFSSISDIPKEVIGQFTDKAIGYNLRSARIISDDTTLNKLNSITMGMRGLNNISRVKRELGYNLHKATKCTHAINVKCGIDQLHATAGDLITISDDLPTWGHSGRLLDYNSTSVTIDSEYTFENVSGNTFLIKYQTANNSYVIANLDVSVTNEGSTLQVIPLQSFPDTPKEDAVYALGNSETYLKDFRLMSVQRVSGHEVEFQAVNHVPVSESTLKSLECAEESSNYSGLEEDTDTSVETIEREDSGTIVVTGGSSPYTWEVSGTGFSLDSEETTDGDNILYADETSCGSATITVTDGVGNTTTFYVRSTEGEWVPTTDYESCGSGNTPRKMSCISGKEKGTLWYYPWGVQNECIGGGCSSCNHCNGFVDKFYSCFMEYFNCSCYIQDHDNCPEYMQREGCDWYNPDGAGTPEQHGLYSLRRTRYYEWEC